MTTPSQATSPRHPFELLFAQLTGRMSLPGPPVIHELGPVPNGVPGQPGRIVWNITSAQPVGLRARPYRRQGADFVGFVAVGFSVEINGGSPLEVVDDIAELVGWLDALVGPAQGAADAGDGYDVGKSTDFETGDGTSTGCGCILPVTLFVPQVYSQIWGRRTVGSVTINVLALKTLDDAPTGDPLNPIEAAA